MRKDYKKMVSEIMKHITLEEYNRWYKTRQKAMKKEDYFFMFSGVRIGRGLVHQAQWEELQKEIPITDEELEYYNNLSKK